MNIAIRCDSSLKLGSGHVSRCATLSRLLLDRGFQVHFFYRPLPGHLKPSQRCPGVVEHEIPTSLDFSQEPDFILGHVKDLKTWKLLVVDHYDLDGRWEKAFDEKIPIFVIDDLANRTHHCQFLLDGNYRLSYEGLYKNLTSNHCQLFLGPGFSLLREDFLIAKKDLRAQARHKFSKVLSFFGGTDPRADSLKFCQALLSLGPKSHGLNWKLVATSSFSQLPELQKLASQIPQFELLVDPPSMAEVFLDSDVYFGSGGTVTWERMYLGLSGWVIAVADNQIPSSQALADGNFQHFLGTSSDLDFQKTLEAFIEECAKGQKLREFSKKSLSLVTPVTIEFLESLISK